MNNFLEKMEKELNIETNMTTTENGAIAYKSTLNACLDLFGTAGALRTTSPTQVVQLFARAFSEDRKTAMRMLFYIRDIRGGMGERETFRTIFQWLANKYPDYVTHNLENVLEFGRADDLLCLLDTDIGNIVIDFIGLTLKEDCRKKYNDQPCSLLAKWLPSENASSPESRRLARKIAKNLGWTPREYRLIITRLRAYLDVVERKMSANEWDEVKYENLPGKASLIYGSAFMRHDEERYGNYLSEVVSNKAKVNAKALFPVDIVGRVLGGVRDSYKETLYDAMWKAMPNVFADVEETGICVVDTSGSMYGEPIKVALSLGLYCADKCKGPFKGHFITFSRRPELVAVRGKTIVDKVRNMNDSSWGMNTDLEKVFNLILQTAIKNHCTQEEIPNKLYIISDMQFDEARIGFGSSYKPFMAVMKDKFERAGYVMPTIVYWDVSARDNEGLFQATFEGENCCMVSGYSPSLFRAVIEGTSYETTVEMDENGDIHESTRTVVNPMDVMYKAVYNERYDCVWAG